jgi:predicted RNA methylase
LQVIQQEEQYHEKEDDIRTMANSLRTSSNNTVYSIHSRKSIQALISKAKERMFSHELPAMDEEASTCGAEVNLKHPLTITHHDDDGARLKETKSLNKLPFRNRNPAL